MVVAGLLGAGWLGLQGYGDARYQDGYDAAVDAGRKQHDHDAAVARETESALRAQLHARDADALQKENEYATNLAAAQRRVRAGTDRLQCPTARAVPAVTTAGDRPVAARPAADGEGPDLVPEIAAEVLGDGADIAGLVRRYQRLLERFEDCRAVNAK